MGNTCETKIYALLFRGKSASNAGNNSCTPTGNNSTTTVYNCITRDNHDASGIHCFTIEGWPPLITDIARENWIPFWSEHLRQTGTGEQLSIFETIVMSRFLSSWASSHACIMIKERAKRRITQLDISTLHTDAILKQIYLSRYSDKDVCLSLYP